MDIQGRDFDDLGEKGEVLHGAFRFRRIFDDSRVPEKVLSIGPGECCRK